MIFRTLLILKDTLYSVCLHRCSLKNSCAKWMLNTISYVLTKWNCFAANNLNIAYACKSPRHIIMNRGCYLPASFLWHFICSRPIVHETNTSKIPFMGPSCSETPRKRWTLIIEYCLQFSCCYVTLTPLVILRINSGQSCCIESRVAMVVRAFFEISPLMDLFLDSIV